MKTPDFVGKEHARPDAADKATGRAVYVSDLVRPGMLYGKIKFSEHAHARIVHIDTSRAERLPGVRAVLTGYNTPEVRIGFLRDNFALKRNIVRQYRDEVAAVAAIDPDIAQEAVGLIRVEYEPLPAVFTPEAAMAEGAVLVHTHDATGKPRQDNLLSLRVHHETGDLAAAIRKSKHVAEGEYSTPIIQQSCMGTAGCIAEFDAHGNLTMWAKTQIPFLAQRDFLRALEAMGLLGKHARVIVPTLGGAFGTGLDTHAYEYIAMLLSHQTGRPVKILYSREEEFANLSPRQPVRVRISQGCDEEGRLTFRKMDVLQDNGAYTSWGATYPTVMLIPATSLYRVGAVYFDAKIVYTHNTYCQAMRGYGNPELTWPIESTLDELAEAAGIDPFEMRMRNRNEPGETTPMGLSVTTCGLRECLEKTAEKLSWAEKRGRQKRVRRGVGMASLIHVGGSGRIYRSDGGGVILKMDDYGTVNVSYGGVEMGQGLHSALVLSVADALGVRPERVVVNQTDTSTCPWDVGTHASRGAFVGCNAAILAAKKLQRKLLAAAAEVYPAEVAGALAQYKKRNPSYVPKTLDIPSLCTPDRLVLHKGEVSLCDVPDEPWLRVDLGKILRALHFRGMQGQVFTEEAYYEPPSELPDWDKGIGNMSATYAYGVQGAEVEVDEETGEVRILRMVSAHDVGQVLNPQTLLGQVYGGLAQGVGFALYEEVHSVEGRIRNPSFTDYKIPTLAEMSFPIDVVFVETQDPAGPFGSKGVGEPGLVPTAPAIANAIFDAIGVRIRDLPITKEKIVAALRKTDT
jgi:xanthine dehydrogenase molybdenum-binding subunit